MKAALLALLLVACGGRPADAPPNILLVVADDLGYGDLGCYGAQWVSTPNLDRLAAEGVRSTAFYTVSPVCSPSRASLLTGRHPRQHGLGWAILGEKNTDGLSKDEVLLPQLLRERGYATGLVGKWHLGATPGCLPHERGFDEFFGMLHASSGYYRHAYRGQPDLWRNGEAVDRDGEYSTELYSDEAVAFIARHADEPFFLELAYNAPHFADDQESLPAPQEYRELYAGPEVPPGKRQLLAVITALDTGLGRVLDALDEHGLARDTLVIFTSDNGPISGRVDLAGLLVGAKDTLDEGGIRVPCLARWPAALPAGAVCDAPSISMDLTATCLAAAGVQPGLELDLAGRDLLAVWKGEAGPPHEALFWDHTSRPLGADGKLQYLHQLAVREGRWRYWRGPDGTRHLHDLEADPGLTQDVSASHPELLAQLQADWEAWNRSLPPADW